MDLTMALVPAVGIVLLVFFTIIFLASRYKRCPSDKILVKFGKVGKGQSAQCIHGGGAFIWPLIQDYTYLSLTPLTIPIPLTQGAVAAEHPHQRAQHLHGRRQHRSSIMNNAAERLLNLHAGRRSRRWRARSSSASCA